MSFVAERARVWARVAGDVIPVVLMLAYVQVVAIRLFPAEGVSTMDFQCFWAASKVALTSTPLDVYDMDVFKAVQRTLHGRPDAPACMFIYLPVSLLLFLPLALLPYTMSAVAWLAVTALFYAFALHGLLRRWLAVPAFFAFPAAFLNAWYVQSGFLSAALFGAAASLLEKQPILAGICFGSLAYKPQLGLVVPVALAAAGRWQAFAAATATVLGTGFTATALFGAGIWPAFVSVLGDAGQWLEATPERAGLDMASVFATVRILTGQVGVAYAVQAASAAAACVLMVAAVRRRPGGQAEGALTAAAVALATPYLFHYDQTILAVPLAWMLAEARRTGFLPWERATWLALVLSPALAHAASLAWNVPVASFVSVGVFAALLRRINRLHAGAPTMPALSREAVA